MNSMFEYNEDQGANCELILYLLLVALLLVWIEGLLGEKHFCFSMMMNFIVEGRQRCTNYFCVHALLSGASSLYIPYILLAAWHFVFDIGLCVSRIWLGHQQ